MAIEVKNTKNDRFNQRCRGFGIPKPTVKRHVEEKIKRPLLFANNCCLTAVPQNIEKQLAKQKHIWTKYSRCNGISVDFAEKKYLTHRFNKNTKLTKKNWLYLLLKRNYKLSVRQPENASIVRARGFNTEAIDIFF